MDKAKNLHGIFFEPPLEANAIGHIMEEVYKTGLYNSVLPQKKEGSVVIDAGANIGITSYFFSSRFEKVYAIEPSSRHFPTLQYMLKYNDIKNVFPHKFALSMLDKEEETFYHYSNKTMDSLYGNLAINNPTGLAQVSSEKVPLKRLDTFVKEQKIDQIDLLKMDVEGVEFEIFGSDSFAKVAPIIKNITCEFHVYGQRNPAQLMDALKINGFKVEIIPNDAHLLIARK